MYKEEILNSGVDRMVYVDPKKVRQKLPDAVVVREGSNVFTCAEVTIEGPSRVVYEREENNKRQEARVWIKTDSKLTLYYDLSNA